ncbi:MAG: hypothetical protein VCD16_11320 [Planctomycetota bacterium]
MSVFCTPPSQARNGRALQREKTASRDRLVEDKEGRVKQWAETLHLATTRHGAASAWAFSSNHFAGHSPETSAQLISRLRDLP